MSAQSAAMGARLMRALASSSAASNVASTSCLSIPLAASLALQVQHRHVWTSVPLLSAQPQPESKESSQHTSTSGGAGSDSSGTAEERSAGGASSSSGNDSSSSSKPSMFHNLAQEVRDTILPLQNLRSYIRRYQGPVAQPYAGTSAITVVTQPQTPWQKAWSVLHDRLGHLPFFSKVAGFKVADTTAYQKGQQLVEDLKEKYETSDHPVVHKVEEYKERVFAGSEASRAMMEIRMRDPTFDMNVFLRSIKLDAPVVTKAFLTHDMATLGEYCGPDIMQRLEGLSKAFQQQGLSEDPTILFVGEVEMVELRLMESDPFLICQFHCQQLKCVRDKFGNVVDGSPDTIHRVYYFWGLQQEKQGVVTAEGELLPPRWVIKDMLWQSMLALV